MIYSLTVTNSIGESLTFELSNPWASGYAIKNIDGLGTPDMNVNTTPYGIGDGSVLGSIKSEYRLITIVLYPLAFPTVETSRQRLYRFFQMKKQILLTFNTENRLVDIDGYVQNITPNIFENPESISIEVKCINPYFHKMANDQTKFYGIEPAFEFPFSVEFDYIGDIEWVNIPLPVSDNWSFISFLNGNFIVLPESSNKVLYSSNGDNWGSSILPSTRRWTSAVYGVDRIVAVGADSNSLGVAYSISGATWVEGYLEGPAMNNPVIDFGIGNYMILDRGTTKYTVSLDSDVSGRWATRNIPYGSHWDFLKFGNSAFFCLETGSKNAVYTTDMTSWNQVPLPFARKWSGLEHGNGIFFAIASDSSDAIYTYNGLDWKTTHIPFYGEDVELIFGDGKFTIFDKTRYGRIASSSDLLFWNEERVPVSKNVRVGCYGNGKLVLLTTSQSVLQDSLSVNNIDLIEFSKFTIDNRMTIEYEGEIDAGIKITIECQSPPGDIIIYNVDTLEYIQIFAERIQAASGAPLGPKDIIEINTESGDKYVRLLRNGTYYNVLGAMNRGMTWFVLKQGPNTFTYTTTDEHAAISMTFSYRDAYAAI